MRRWISLMAVLATFGCGDDRDGRDGSGGRCAAPAPALCAASGGHSGPVTLSGDSIDSPRDAQGSCGGRGHELVFHWTAPSAGQYTFDTEGSDFDTVLYVREGCEGAELGCNDDVRGGVVHSRLRLDLEACQSVVVYVDGYDANDSGQVRLAITTSEAVCDDGLDNDGDGLVDCDDPDCALACGPTATWPDAWSSFEEAALAETNRYRAMGASCDGEAFPAAPALEMNETLRIAARLHSTDMGERRYFEHENLDGLDPFDRIRAIGFEGALPWGENIAGGQRTPEEVVQGWMQSPGHCRNIMNPQFRVIGLGYAWIEGSPLGHYWTQKFGGGH